MIRLSKKLLLAIEATVDIAYDGHVNPVRAAQIAQREGIPLRYLEPVMQELVREGILVGIRGPNGGYQLGRAPHKITLGDIVRTVRGLETAEDPMTASTGSALAHQVVRPLWIELQDETMRRLDSITLEYLCNRARTVGIKGRASPVIAAAVVNP